MASGNSIPRPDPLEIPDLDEYRNTTKDWETPWAGGRISAASLLRLAHKVLDFGPGHPHRSFLTASRKLLLTDPDIDDNETDGQWEAVRVLGAGSFGTVGLWRKLTEAREVTDEMAIKHVDLKQINQVHKSIVPKSEELLKEAVFMCNLNRDGDSQNINHLRQYKYNRRATLARFYMICCPYTDLSHIQERYMVWDAYLLENFIWHVFIQLARGLQTMERPPDDENPYQEPPGTHWKTAYLLHYDLKPANVMLDYPSMASAAPDVGVMPYLRISDFSSSTYSSDTTPAVFHVASTPGYKSPEQLASVQGRSQAYWRKPHNVWAVGKTVFDITCQAEPSALEDDKNDAARTMQMGGPVKDGHFAPEDMSYYAEIFHKHYRDEQPPRFTYSADLLRLIRDCLEPCPERRPTSLQILERAQAGQEAHLNGLKAGADTNGSVPVDKSQSLRQISRLHYVGNEINEMSMGDANFSLRRRRDLFAKQLKEADPDLPTLHPPASVYDEYRPDGAQQAVRQLSEYVVKIGDQIVSLKDIEIIGGEDMETAKINARPAAYAKVDKTQLLVEIVCRREEAGSTVSLDDVDDLENLGRAGLIAELIKLDVAQGKLSETPTLMLKRKAFEIKHRALGRDVVKQAIKDKKKTVLARKGIANNLRIAALARMDQLDEIKKDKTQTEQGNPETEAGLLRNRLIPSVELLESRQRIQELEAELARIRAEKTAHQSATKEIQERSSTPSGDRPPSTGHASLTRPSSGLEVSTTHQPTHVTHVTQPTQPVPPPQPAQPAQLPQPAQPLPPPQPAQPAQPANTRGRKRRKLDPVLAIPVNMEPVTGKRTRRAPVRYQ